jgi:hypothetical protein
MSGVPVGEKLGGGLVAEGLVGTDVVVDMFPLAEVFSKAGDSGRTGGAVVELLSEGAVGADVFAMLLVPVEPFQALAASAESALR